MPELAGWPQQIKAAHIGLVWPDLGASPAPCNVQGPLALQRARSPKGRAASHVAALLVYPFIVSMARAHQPFGVLQAWTTHGA